MKLERKAVILYDLTALTYYEVALIKKGLISIGSDPSIVGKMLKVLEDL